MGVFLRQPEAAVAMCAHSLVTAAMKQHESCVFTPLSLPQLQMLIVSTILGRPLLQNSRTLCKMVRLMRGCRHVGYSATGLHSSILALAHRELVAPVTTLRRPHCLRKAHQCHHLVQDSTVIQEVAGVLTANVRLRILTKHTLKIAWEWAGNGSRCIHAPFWQPAKLTQISSFRMFSTTNCQWLSPTWNLYTCCMSGLLIMTDIHAKRGINPFNSNVPGCSQAGIPHPVACPALCGIAEAGRSRRQRAPRRSRTPQVRCTSPQCSSRPGACLHERNCYHYHHTLSCQEARCVLQTSCS